MGGYRSGGKALQTLRVGSVRRLLKESNKAQSFLAQIFTPAHMLVGRLFRARNHFHAEKIVFLSDAAFCENSCILTTSRQ